jgi:proton-translocating NADH-quinone oxidoreductase chain N
VSDAFILVPLAGLILLNLPFLPQARKAALGFIVALAVAQGLAIVIEPASFWAGQGPLHQFLSFRLESTPLARVLLLSIGVVVASSALVARSMVADEKHRSLLINLMLVAMVGMNGISLVADLFSLFVFIEVTAVASFILIASSREIRALEGAFKYILLSAVAGILMFSAVALLMMVTGGTSFAEIRSGLHTSGSNIIAKIAVGAFFCGLFIKGGLVPFHGWLPDAYSAASAPVSVLLAGIVTKVCGIYGLVRLASGVLGPNDMFNVILMAVGALSIVVGALAAMGQTDLKRMLAYSSISQIGYIVLGLGCGSPLGLVGAVFHLFNHAVFKGLLFVNAAGLEQRLGTTDMNRMSGLGSRMPVTGITNVIATLSTAGIPPLAGFWSKLIIILALWQSGQHVYAVVAVLFSVVTLGYLLIMQRRIFFGRVAEGFKDVREAGMGIVVPAVALAILTIAAGLALPWVLKTLMLPAGGL